MLATASPAQAPATANGSTPAIDLVVTDVVMPGMNGSELADRITELHADARVLFTWSTSPV